MKKIIEPKSLQSTDDINRSYFETLLTQKFSSQKIKPPRLNAEAYFVDEAPETLKPVFWSANFEEVSKLDPSQRHETMKVHVMRLQAGVGSSIERAERESRVLKLIERSEPDFARLFRQTAIGAKGTDLFVDLARLGWRSIAELTRLQCEKMAERHGWTFIWYDLVGPETQSRVKALWRRLATTLRVKQGSTLCQDFMPTLDEQENLTDARRAPAGHGFFAISVLKQFVFDSADSAAELAVMSNGEDLNAFPSSELLQWVVSAKVPIALVVTEKTEIDAKGGVVTVVDGGGVDKSYVKILETAEAAQNGQEEILNNAAGWMNTNLVILNISLLRQKLAQDAKHWLSAATPDLIQNKKTQIDSDGVARVYTQLEGAMSSCFLNLNKAYRQAHGESLVCFVKVPRAQRTECFTPVKSAFDFWFLYGSDRFRLDPNHFRLIDLRPGHRLPSITLKDEASKDRYYRDVQNIITSFSQCGVADLESLDVHGVVSLQRLALAGKVSILNEVGEPVDLANDWLHSGRSPEVRDSLIKIAAHGAEKKFKITISPHH